MVVDAMQGDCFQSTSGLAATCKQENPKSSKTENSSVQQVQTWKVLPQCIRALYHCRRCILWSATINTDTRVCQEDPSSCLLFVFYINKLVKMMKEQYNKVDFLGNLHVLSFSLMAQSFWPPLMRLALRRCRY